MKQVKNWRSHANNRSSEKADIYKGPKTIGSSQTQRETHDCLLLEGGLPSAYDEDSARTGIYVQNKDTNIQGLKIL